MKVHDFEINGGNEPREGKSHWPDCLNISLNKRDAIRLMEKLIRYIGYEEENSIIFSFCGKLDYDIDEDADDN